MRVIVPAIRKKRVIGLIAIRITPIISGDWQNLHSTSCILIICVRVLVTASVAPPLNFPSRSRLMVLGLSAACTMQGVKLGCSIVFALRFVKV